MATASTETVTFASGALMTTLDLTIKADADVEGDEQFLVTMAVSDTGHVVDELYQTTVVIGDEDTPGKLRKHSCNSCKQYGIKASANTEPDPKPTSLAIGLRIGGTLAQRKGVD